MPNGMHGQMTFGGRRIMMGQGNKDRRMQSPAKIHTDTMGVFIYMANVDEHFERARDAGRV